MHILNNKGRNLTQYGVVIEDEDGSDFYRGLINVRGNSIWGPTHLVKVAGNFRVSVVDNEGGNGVVGGRIVWLTTTAGGTLGPREVLVRNNDHDGSYLEPLFQGVQSYASGTVLTGSKVHNYPSVAANSFQSTTVTVTGAEPGDKADAWMSLTTAGLFFTAKVTAADTVTVWVHNFTGHDFDPSNGTIYVKVEKRG